MYTTPAYSHQSPQVKKEQRFACWKKYYLHNREYHKQCSELSVSGKHIRKKRRVKLTLNVGDGVAKVFPTKVFYGKITGYMKEEEWWHVRYEDGDQEDLDKEEVTLARDLYMFYRHAHK